MIRLLLFVVFLAPFSAFACDADPPPVALEFLKSKHVFWGQVTSKVYAKDSLTYTVTFTVDRNFKKEASIPKTLAFTLQAEGEITGRYSSCDFGVSLGQKWLIYTYERNGILAFSYNSSNSKPADSLDAIPNDELEILQSGHTIDYRKITFERLAIRNPASIDYIGPSPKFQLDSLVGYININNFEQSGQFVFENFIARIDSLGNTTELFIPDRQGKLGHDQMYDVRVLVFPPLESLNPLQQELLHVLKVARQWEPAQFRGKAVNSLINFQVYLNKQRKLILSGIY